MRRFTKANSWERLTPKYPYFLQAFAPNRLKILSDIPLGCHAWVSKTIHSARCNTIPCCAWQIRHNRINKLNK